MKLATLRLGDETRAVRIQGEEVIEVPGSHADVASLIVSGVALDTDGGVTERVHDLRSAQLAPPILKPGKVICVGLNYRTHILEMGRELPEFPTLFTKVPEALIGPKDPIQVPPESSSIDWEGELVVVVGKQVRRACRDEAEDAIFGYTIMNDITMRDYQYRTPQWFQGKTWENSTPIGPVIVTADELSPHASLVTRVDGEEVQRASIDDLVFDAAALVQYISTIFTLNPGDLIATGTPGGVGHAHKPARYLVPGQQVSVAIDGIGELTNQVVAEDSGR
ncbi:fumarylacetoacetate hydrolase family protein [Tessaracoccus sp. MC1865]|uniref:fumarylacetoacetate hydrolase family protein n=1 Tax=Tessaracoccus sp. MC1865 TaxID=2760310 RepID=UPI0016034A58|nr:fumarylacetoacetate hydrolase family protein [Tessaracoccus sp. MC1865]MBB1482620.1 fumarylacetoacetate hydrolase family protein [Tessaracoccus sp. MC1865]QTO37929.1 fumarylacetoacetate hydrolase family protein [Tessaracoccus sp. MC1865]